MALASARFFRLASPVFAIALFGCNKESTEVDDLSVVASLDMAVDAAVPDLAPARDLTPSVDQASLDLTLSVDQSPPLDLTSPPDLTPALSPGCVALNTRTDHLSVAVQGVDITATFYAGEKVVVHYTPVAAPADTYVQSWWKATPIVVLTGNGGSTAGSTPATAAPSGVTGIITRLMGTFVGNTDWTITYTCTGP